MKNTTKIDIEIPQELILKIKDKLKELTSAINVRVGMIMKRYEYTDTKRKTTDIGVKIDITKKRATRQGYYTIKEGPLNPLPSKKPGRPKGPKNKKKIKRSNKNKKRGRKGLFKVFDKGK
ncbi:MAG: hypothetical protein ACTSRZ_11995, partial [Promethearchaeota archaeon]